LLRWGAGAVLAVSVVAWVGAIAFAREPTPAEIAAREARAAEYARYGALGVTWVADRVLAGVRGVFPHPAIPSRVYVVTESGLSVSDDSGRSWRALPTAAADKVGPICDLAFSPSRPDAFYLGTAGRGVWVTEDAGKTFRRIGSRQTGLVSDTVRALRVATGDARFRTLLALHGKDAPGISRSYDAGKTWHVIGGDYHVYDVFGNLRGWGRGSGSIVVASKKTAPDLQSGFFCNMLDDLWSEVVRDIVYADGAQARDDTIYFATSDRGILRVDEAGGYRVGPRETDRLASVGATWGPREDKEILFAYEPKKLGLILSLDGMKTWAAYSQGLFVGPFVREDSHIRAAANGRMFFAAVNGRLYKGYVTSRGVSVTETAVTPAVFTYERRAFEQAQGRYRAALHGYPKQHSAAQASRELLSIYEEMAGAFNARQFTVTARVLSLQGSPASVTVDLQAVRGPDAMPMYDDGKHDDGQAGDGVFGCTLRVNPASFCGRGRRGVAAGSHGLAVKAVGSDGTIGGAVAPLWTFDLPESYVLWDNGKENPLQAEEGAPEVPRHPDAEEAYVGSCCMKWTTTGEGPWRVAYVAGSREVWNAAGYYALTFRIRSDGEGNDLLVRFRDSPLYEEPSVSEPLAVVKDKLIEGGKIDDEYRRVVIPIERIAKAAGSLSLDRMGAIVFSGDGDPRTYWVDDVRLVVNQEDLEQDSSPPAVGGRKGTR